MRHGIEWLAYSLGLNHHRAAKSKVRTLRKSACTTCVAIKPTCLLLMLTAGIVFAELPLDPQALLGFMPGWDSVAGTEIQAGTVASAATMRRCSCLGQRFGREGPSAESVLPQVVTSERQVADWHIFFNRRAK
jgi:hypothetical protein